MPSDFLCTMLPSSQPTWAKLAISGGINTLVDLVQFAASRRSDSAGDDITNEY